MQSTHTQAAQINVLASDIREHRIAEKAIAAINNISWLYFTAQVVPQNDRYTRWEIQIIGDIDQKMIANLTSLTRSLLKLAKM